MTRLASGLRRVPILPTLIVLLAAAVMVRLGFWQLDRLHQKEALVARYAAALHDPRIVPLVALPVGPGLDYRRVALACPQPSSAEVRAGHNAHGETGWAHSVHCPLGSGSIAVVLGWSDNPGDVVWGGGAVSGVVAPAGAGGARIIANPPLAGLAANADPDPADIPNNHLAYAVQWFLFAGTALLIYGLALRKRLAAAGQRG
ncbi:MAG: hypothetical protein RIQ99_1151 [Pseudomonadota bacterium]|jgi:surfeit locus 1 family protein